MKIWLGPAIGALIAAVLVIAAYQVQPAYDIPLGTTTDAPLLRGFNRAEQIADNKAGPTFRWSSGDSSITLQDGGRQDFDAVLSVNGLRPPGQPPGVLTMTVASKAVLQARPGLGPQDFAFKVPRELVADGTLDLHLTSNAFS